MIQGISDKDVERTLIPDFLIVGAMKSATTSLWATLKAHPGIYMTTPKEPHFFALPEFFNLFSRRHQSTPQKKLPTSLSEYQSLFEPSGQGQVRGEASASYFLLSDVVIPRIKELLGDPRIIISLRNPYERCWSEFEMTHGGRARPDPGAYFVTKARDALSVNRSELPQFIEQSLYASRVRAFLQNFSKVHILTVDQLTQDSTTTLSGLCDFLGVSTDCLPSAVIVRNTGRGFVLPGTIGMKLFSLMRHHVPRLKIYLGEKRFFLLKQFAFQRARKRVLMPHEGRKLLRSLFEPDIVELEKLLQRDFSHWKERS